MHRTHRLLQQLKWRNLHLLYMLSSYIFALTWASAVHRIRTCKPFTANGFQDRSLTTRTHGIYGSFQLLRVPRLPTQFSPTSNADGCRYVRYHRQILPPTCQWDAQRGFYNFSLLKRRGEDSNLRSFWGLNRLAICRIKPALPPRQSKNQRKKNKIEREVNKMFDPEVKEPLIKILLFLYKLRVYRKRMVSASHKYHLKKIVLSYLWISCWRSWVPRDGIEPSFSDFQSDTLTTYVIWAYLDTVFKQMLYSNSFLCRKYVNNILVQNGCMCLIV